MNIKKLFFRCFKCVSVRFRLHRMSRAGLEKLIANCSDPDEVYVTSDDIRFNMSRYLPTEDTTRHCFRKALLRIVPLEKLDLLINNWYHLK